MLRFSFSLDELPAHLVDSDTSAYYRLDGTLRLHHGTEVVVEEAGVPIVEFAVWLCRWWASRSQTQAFAPDGSDPDDGPMLQLAPAGGTHYRLTYTWKDTPGICTAEQAQWENAVTQFRKDVCQLVWARYHLRLDRLWPSS